MNQLTEAEGHAADIHALDGQILELRYLLADIWELFKDAPVEVSPRGIEGYWTVTHRWAAQIRELPRDRP